MIDSARFQWDEGNRRLAREVPDVERYRQLCDLVDAVCAELRRRLGQHFTLAELATAHAVAADWIRDIVCDETPPNPRVGIGDAALVQDAAFFAYARGAGDYRP